MFFSQVTKWFEIAIKSQIKAFLIKQLIYDFIIAQSFYIVKFRNSLCRTVRAGSAGGTMPWHHQIQLTLSQPGGVDYVHHVTTGPPDFQTFLRSCYGITPYFLVIFYTYSKFFLSAKCNWVKSVLKSNS
jgi:hypothetical protein